MFRHKGKGRTFAHNLRLAVMLSVVAGMVNIVGVLAVGVLTTNVTGHFAYFAEHFFLGDYTAAYMFLLYILCFLLGAFACNMMIETANLYKPRIAHTPPMLIEATLLAVCALWGNSLLSGNLTACMLLFAMGLQNAMVTQVSQSIVRTTHLTGLFTDLGIELSQLLFYKQPAERSRLGKSIGLRLAIIFSFFAGCLLGGLLYSYRQMDALLYAAGILLLALFYDSVRYRIYTHSRKRNLG